MIEIDKRLIENLSAEEQDNLFVAVKKAEELDDIWIDTSSKLFPVRAQLRSLVRFIEVMTGLKGDNALGKLVRMFKFIFNINNIRNEVKKADATHKRIKEESKELFEKEEIAAKELEKWEFIVGSIIYHRDQMMADGFAFRCKNERKKFVEETIEKMVKEYDKALPYEK